MDLEQRKWILFSTVLDYSFGTLWRVDETFWQAEFKHYHSSRKWHPGFSIYTAYKSRPGIFTPFIPMLFGSSKRHGAGFAVRGMTRERGENHVTWFTTLGKNIPNCSADDFFGRKAKIAMNVDKPVATEQEKADAHAFLKRIHHAREK